MNSNKKNQITDSDKPRVLTISRRTFLAISGALSAVFTASRARRNPVSDIIVPTEEGYIQSLSEKWIAISCLNCTARCATRAWVVTGKDHHGSFS